MKKIIIPIALVVVSIGGWKYFDYQKKKKEAFDRVGSISVLVTPVKSELAKLYSERYEMLVSFEKAVGGKLPDALKAPFTGSLVSEQDLAAYDQYQLQVTNRLGELLSRPELKKRIKDLEILENKINKKRAEYAELAGESVDLVTKFKTGQPPAPEFPAEKVLHQMPKK